MTVEIVVANTDAEIEACFASFKELRPHLLQEEFLPQVRRQQLQGYQMLALRHEGIVKSAAGFAMQSFWRGGKLFISTISLHCLQRVPMVLRGTC